MKSVISFAAASLLWCGSSAFAASLDPTGTWLTEDGRAKIHVDKCGADHTSICGSVVWLKDPLDEKGHPKLDVKNPDPAKRTRPALGMPLFVDLKPDEDQIYAGEIYNAENGKNYSVTLQVEKASELHVKGCMLSVLCGSQDWSRVADVPPTVLANSQTKKSKVAPAQ